MDRRRDHAARRKVVVRQRRTVHGLEYDDVFEVAVSLRNSVSRSGVRR
jgi:hypothetical protein